MEYMNPVTMALYYEKAIESSLDQYNFSVNDFIPKDGIA